ncbi:MAG: cupin domain-containing protein, partial [Pseudomonadota bacterium]
MDTEFILDQMETSAEPFAVCQLHGRGDLPLGKDPMATLHYILAGRGEIIMPDAPPIEIEQGSLVLIPSLCRHMGCGFCTSPKLRNVCLQSDGIRT